MRAVGLLAAQVFWAGLLGCGRDHIEIISLGPDGSVAPVDTTPLPLCPTTLAERLSFATIHVDKGVAWQKPGYDYFPADERIALAVQPDGQAQIAWAEVNPTKDADGRQQTPLGVHITPLDERLSRRADDTVLATAREVGGLVAHDDGFALLTRDTNPGPKIDNGDGDTIAFLVRYQDGQPPWRKPLTGSDSGDAPETFTLYSPFLEGQLVWTGTSYGAYFVVEGGIGDPMQKYWRDALVFRDPFGLPAAWTVAHGCQNNGGIRLIVDRGKTNLLGGATTSYPEITGLCVHQAPAPEKTVKFTALEADAVVSNQEEGWPGYAGARLGSLLKVADGYLVFWLSLGATNEHQGHDIRFARLDKSFVLVEGPSWAIPRTPNIEEWNLHVVPYGPERFLMIYEEIDITGPVSTADYALYFGNFAGTHLTLLDAGGRVLSDEVVQDAPITANAEPVVLPGGDVAWPFVNPSPDFTQTATEPNGPGLTALHIARIRYCQ
jgi:hypothetical protein